MTGSALAAAQAVPPVAGVSALTTDSLDMVGLTYDGIVKLDKADGSTIEVLEFSMASAKHTPFTLHTDLGGTSMTYLAGSLTVSGTVHVYCTSLVGTWYLLGIPIPVNYNPGNPPLLVPSPLTLNKVTIGLVDVQAAKLDASGFTLTS